MSKILVSKLETEIKLKDLGYTSCSGTLAEEKRKAAEELEKQKLLIENAVRTSAVTLVRGEQEYRQFPIKDILE